MSSQKRSKNLKSLEAASASLRNSALTDDIKEALRKTWVFYIKTYLSNRFKGRVHNPLYPLITKKYSEWKFKRYGAKPLLVRSGALRQKVLSSSKVGTRDRGKKYQILFSAPFYGKYLEKLGFDYISPNARELKLLKSYFFRTLSKIRNNRIKS